MNRAKTLSNVPSGSQLSLSILFTTTIGLSPSARDFLSTNLVCGMGPSSASTSSSTPSTILRTRSTSLPKSACPGVSTICIVVFPYFTDVFFESMVMPRSRSRSLESIIHVVCSPLLSLNAPVCLSMASTSVVLPWSTCAIMATLRRSSRCFKLFCSILFS